MLTRLIVKNFKRFDEVDIELGDPVVFIGPNNSGKTSALQALALWEIGVRRWNEKRKGGKTPEKRPGVTINRRDLVSVPVPNANLLWRDLHVRDVRKKDGKQKTKNICVDITVRGISEGKEWQCGLEFDYANDESFYCRPLRITEESKPDRMPVSPEAEKVRIAFLPPMSGLAANETRLDRGAINVRVGEGRTAEVLRNLCHIIYEERLDDWITLQNQIESLFGATLDMPKYVPERGEIDLTYRERGTRLDLSSSGTGLQQTLLLLSYMYANPGSVLLLDEPDAHLEILRQRQIYDLFTDVARKSGSQIIAASHSEVLLNEAANRDVVIAFIGKPHRLNDRGSQVRKALINIGFEHYYQAEQTGWVLYLEGSTDLAILRSFAKKLNHEGAIKALERPFVHYVGNSPNAVGNHFHGLKEAVPHLKGLAIFDKLEAGIPENLGAEVQMWEKREIENYLCFSETLEGYAKNSGKDEAVGLLFEQSEIERRLKAMNESISEVEKALETLGKHSPWDPKTKVSDDFFAPLFQKYFKKLGLPNIMLKKNYHELTYFVPTEKIDSEVKQKLNAVVHVCKSATCL